MDADAFLERLAAWTDGRDDVRALFVVGSQARTETPADRWSDLDVVLVVDDPAAYLRDAGWLAPLGRAVLTFVEPTATGGGLERRVLFENGDEVDVSVFPVGGLPESDAEVIRVLRRGYRVLRDDVGIAEDLARLVQEDVAPPAFDFAGLSNDTWYHLLWAAKKLRRGEVWFAWQGGNDLQWRVVALLRRRAELDGTDAWHTGRFLEQWAPPEAVARLCDASSRPEADDVARGLRALAQLYADVERHYAAAAGVAIPVDQQDLLRRLDELLTR